MLSACILLAMICPVSAEETADAVSGVETNVYFCKLIEVGDNYDLEPLPTLFFGKNDFDRLIFATGSDNLDSGDYALVQMTEDGIVFIQTLTIEPSGSATPEYVILKLEIREQDLSVPLEINEPEPEPSKTPTIKTPAEQTTTPQSPLGTVSVLVAVVLAMFCVVLFKK